MSRNGVVAEPRGEVKRRLEAATESTLNDLGSLARQLNRGSKSSETVLNSAKAFASLEGFVESTESSLKRMGLVVAHLSFQADAVQRAFQVQSHVLPRIGPNS